MIRTDDASSNGAIPGQMLIGSTWGSVLHPWLVSRRSSWIVRPRPAPMLTTFASTSRHLADLVMSLMQCDMLICRVLMCFVIAIDSDLQRLL